MSYTNVFAARNLKIKQTDMKRLFALAIGVTILFTTETTFAQEAPEIDPLNPVNTAVPFMTISPDSRSGALGDAGVATSTDVYSQHWNSSKYAFAENKIGFGISYTPWLKKLVNDMSISYLSGYFKFDKNQAIGVGLRYFSMGAIDFTDNDGKVWQSFNPHEFAFDLSYNRKLGEHFSLGLAPRFIYSNLTGGLTNGDEVSQSGKSIAIDINGYYNNDIELFDKDAHWTFGFNIANIGNKMSYTETEKNFIPTNLKLGGGLTIDIDDYNSITTTLELGKLLVPTPPVYYDSTDASGKKVIYKGKDPEVAPITGMVQSFYDAPRGFEEEMEEITYSIGLEYWYAKQFAVRAGYFHEHKNKGNRKYFTAGVGVQMNVFGLDFAYLIPAGGSFQNSPLQGTWRFSLLFNINEL